MSLSAASTNLHISTQIYLTSPRTGSRICRKERKNSESTAVSAPVSIAVFLRLLFERTDAFLRREGGSHTTPARGKLPAGLLTGSYPPDTLGASRKNVSPRFPISSTGDVPVPHGAPSTPGNPSARQISLAFGLIADTLEWPNEDYQAFIARLVGVGVSPLAITLGDVLMAYTAQCDARRHARGADSQGAH
ncbi:hypothetical protein Smp_36 [Stenotrophomonas phage Smp131]|uniref:Uncharacterized protein n=1 Tax=Stenotrophomonas phage Smp131 TaxID=1168563 RepID=V9IQX5_9CAUD|nr:hypothetical protein [Stenotrophomonas sp. GD03777]YP_009008392.1 anti-repressor [Stenotrophomonas phage Smp131]AFJ75506.1 hypothetical protein Smp_36 [Stenotrophomonas phage Smp131]MDH1660072.1 hypothetical protein [Stenotrophomonas sp. GD03777]